MKIIDTTDLEFNPVDLPGAKNVEMVNLFSGEDGVPNFAMRLFHLSEGGETPLHKHPYEHETYVLSGEGILYLDGKEYEFKEGYALYVPANLEHNFRQKGNKDLKFLCMIPILPDGSNKQCFIK